MGQRVILHVDMDAFFASVEQRDDPSLRGKPVLVGGRSRRGVVAAASYEARPFGCRSAMPMMTALRLCPDAVVVSPQHGRYSEVSKQVFDIFRRYTPLVEGLSLDEAFLDVTESGSLFGDGEAIAQQIRRDIDDELQLTASVGVAACKFVAKIASDLDKPDGLTVVPTAVSEFLAPLPIERMWGAGPRAVARLRQLGLTTLGDLAAASNASLRDVFGNRGEYVRVLARGEDDRPVVPGRAAKSIGSEETFEEDLHTRAELERAILDHSTQVARRLVVSGLWARSVQLKAKYADFKLVTRQKQFSEPVADTNTIYAAACELIDALPQRRQGIRLVGVQGGDLTTSAGQMSLFDVAGERRPSLDSIAATIDERYGIRTLTRAALLEARPARSKRPGG
jgi:DNA polymerase-4